jgi:Na+-translocating ferredoxin:NAD+ oxidoreductase RnfC subunit
MFERRAGFEGSIMELKALLDAVEAAGVVGAGGGGFPTAVKLKAEADTIIINGAECEPLLNADHLLMVHYADMLIQTLAVLVKLTGACQGIIALKGKYEGAVQAFTDVIGSNENLRLFKLADRYPVGDEHLLVQNVTGRSIPPGGLPFHVGVIVINVETLYNIGHALAGKPVTCKFVTIAGDVKQPITVKAPLGITAGELLDLAGGPGNSDYLLIEGGPCMGKPTTSGKPITKTTGGLIALPTSHPLAMSYSRTVKKNLNLALSVCSQCHQCTDLCPRRLIGHPLEPHRIMRAVSYNIADKVALPQALLCSECGVCDLYACPFGLSPRHMNQLLKVELKRNSFRPTWKPASIPRGYEGRQIPYDRLLRRMGLAEYNQEAVWMDTEVKAKSVSLPLQQHTGAPSVPIVQIGQKVKEGELIAEIPTGKLGAALHASLTGQVVEIGNEIVIRGGVA